jgi:hypothetical protein
MSDAKAGTAKGGDNPGYKIFPRNLTARAGYIVTGNPTNSRPEAGVDNCFPGLEFDQRNLDQRFFPGLVFYYHRADGARLIEARAATGLSPNDVANPPLYLWSLLGRFLVTETDPSTVSFQQQSGMEIWRRVHDLLPGTVAIVVGPTPGLAITDPLAGELQTAYNAASTASGTSSKIVRDSDGKVQYVRRSPRALPRRTGRHRPAGLSARRHNQDHVRAVDVRLSRLLLFLLVIEQAGPRQGGIRR